MEPCSEKSLVGIGIENESERRANDDLAMTDKPGGIADPGIEIRP